MLRNLRTGIESRPLARPFRISRGVKTTTEVVTVELREGDAWGAGEAVPYAHYGETMDSVTSQIGSVESAIAAGASRTELLTLLPPGAARNAVDCALWDLEAQLSGRVLAEEIAGGPLRTITTAVTIGLDSADRMAEAATALRGAELVKVKLNADDPETSLRAIRAVLRQSALIVDPNESWNMAILERMQPVLRELDVAFVEQPLPAGEDDCLSSFEPLVPICADESCHTAEDLDRLAGRYGLINIKLDKTGGLTEAIGLRDEARSRGFGIMVGCMICTSLSIAPALHIAADADYVDLDGPWWLEQDRPGGIRVENGKLTPPARGFWGS